MRSYLYNRFTVGAIALLTGVCGCGDNTSAPPVNGGGLKSCTEFSTSKVDGGKIIV